MSEMAAILQAIKASEQSVTQHVLGLKEKVDEQGKVLQQHGDMLGDLTQRVKDLEVKAEQTAGSVAAASAVSTASTGTPAAPGPPPGLAAAAGAAGPNEANHRLHMKGFEWDTNKRDLEAWWAQEQTRVQQEYPGTRPVFTRLWVPGNKSYKLHVDFNNDAERYNFQSWWRNSGPHTGPNGKTIYVQKPKTPQEIEAERPWQCTKAVLKTLFAEMRDPNFDIDHYKRVITIESFKIFSFQDGRLMVNTVEWDRAFQAHGYDYPTFQRQLAEAIAASARPRRQAEAQLDHRFQLVTWNAAGAP